MDKYVVKGKAPAFTTCALRHILNSFFVAYEILRKTKKKNADRIGICNPTS
jgi:hypothetical protein